MTARLALHLEPHQLPEFQRAARLLLRSPLVTNAVPDDFASIRKWESVLRQEFTQRLGYRLDVTRSAARLLRKPSALTSHRPARLPSGRALNRWGYVYFALALAALERPGQQVLASELLSNLKDLAMGDDRLAIDQTDYSQRRAFSDAIHVLVSFGVLIRRDGRLEQLMNDEAVLFDIDRNAAALCLVASPSVLREVKEVGDFLVEPMPGSSEGRSRLARQLLNRRMIDQPVVLFGDLTVDEQELAWRNRRREAENITRLTGCEIELRREGLALIDVVVQPIGPRSFPGRSSVAQASLLWLDRLLESSADAGEVERSSNRPSTEPSIVERLIVERSVSMEDADRLWAEIVVDYGDRFNADARNKPDAFRAEVVSELEQFGLISRRVDDLGVAELRVSPAAARYRAEAVFVGSTEGDVRSAGPSARPTAAEEGRLW